MEERTWTRTFAAVLGGVTLSFVVPLILARVFLPDELKLIAKAFVTPSNSPEWTEISHQFHRTELIAVYVINPLAGLAVGIFVALLQRSRALIFAAGCMIPDFLYGLLGNRPRMWVGSTRGILYYLFDHSLPFMAALLIAALCQRIIKTRREEAASAI